MIGKTENINWNLIIVSWMPNNCFGLLRKLWKVGVQFDVINIVHVNSLILQFMSTLKTNVISSTKIVILQDSIEINNEIK